VPDYNKYTPGSIKRDGYCSDCGQRGWHHASYCAFNPTRQKAVAAQLEKAKMDMRFIDLWNVIDYLKKEIKELKLEISKLKA